MEPATHQPRQARRPAGYVERLRTPWWWYPAGVAVAALLGLEVAVVLPGWTAWAPIAILLLAALLVVRWLSSGTVSIDGTTLRAGVRSVPVAEIDLAIDLSPTELRRLVGRHGDPLAFTYIRSWVGPGVQLVLRPKPAGPEPGHEEPRLAEPYWVVSTRHPDRLLAALQAARAAGSQPPPD